MPGQFLAHAVIWIGLAITALPLYIAFVASTLSNPEIAQAPMPMLPGDQAWENYSRVLIEGMQGNFLSPPVWVMLLNSLIMALVIAVGKIAVSLISAYACLLYTSPSPRDS